MLQIACSVLIMYHYVVSLSHGKQRDHLPPSGRDCYHTKTAFRVLMGFVRPSVGDVFP